jgi:hypothetical protein
MLSKFRLPSPAMVVALVALFVALGGTAVAAGPIVKRALLADNALKLQGKTLSAVVQQAAAEGAKLPGPASSAAGLVSTKSTSASVAADGEGEFAASCDAGQKVVSGGYSTSGPVISFDSRPTSDTTWSVYLANLSQSNAANISVYAVCLG